MSTKMELNELLSRTAPDVVLCETKWKNEWGTPETGDDKYDLWMKNRSGKGGGGVIILTKKCVKVKRVIKSGDKSEILQVMIRRQV